MEFEKAKNLKELNISNKVVYEFLNKIEEKEEKLYSFILIKDGKIAIEKSVFPFDGTKYDFSEFSVSKGFISTAVGFAIAENKMSLDDSILKFFPEYETKSKKGKQNASVTIRQLLTMSSNKKVSFIKDMTKGNFCDDWVKYKFRKNKGFMYSNDDVYMVAAALTRIYNQSVVEILKPRLFDPLNIQTPFWETTQQNIEVGATGLRLKPMDLAKVAYCYLNNGKYNGKQVIPEFWAKCAGKYYVDLPPYYGRSKKYGYYFWGDPHGGYRFDGMYGQWAYVFPNHNAVLVINGQTCRINEIIDETFDHFPRAFEDKDEQGYDKLLSDKLLSYDNNNFKPTNIKSSLEEDIKAYTYSFKKYSHADFIGYPISMIPMVVSSTFSKKPKRSMDKLSFDFFDEKITLKWEEDNKFNVIDIGRDGNYLETELTLATVPYKFLSTSRWEDEKTLFIEIRPIQTPAIRYLKCTFNKNKIKMKVYSSPTIREFGLGYLGEVSKQPTGLYLKILEIAFKIMQPTLKSRGKKQQK